MDRLTPALFFLLIQYTAEMDNASDIINVGVKRGVKWAWYLLAPLWMTWLHPGDSVWWRTNPQICIPMLMIHEAYSKHLHTNIWRSDICEGCVGEWMDGWVRECMGAKKCRVANTTQTSFHLTASSSPSMPAFVNEKLWHTDGKHRDPSRLCC